MSRTYTIVSSSIGVVFIAVFLLIYYFAYIPENQLAQNIILMDVYLNNTVNSTSHPPKRPTCDYVYADAYPLNASCPVATVIIGDTCDGTVYPPNTVSQIYVNPCYCRSSSCYGDYIYIVWFNKAPIALGFAIVLVVIGCVLVLSSWVVETYRLIKFFDQYNDVARGIKLEEGDL